MPNDADIIFNWCLSLIDIGADVNWRGSDGTTPLLAAVRRSHTDTAHFLIVHGADINARGADSLTALHVACRRGDMPTTNLLLDYGADVSLQTCDGATAEDLAREKGLDDIVRRLFLSQNGNGMITSEPALSYIDATLGNQVDRLLSIRRTRKVEASSTAIETDEAVQSPLLSSSLSATPVCSIHSVCTGTC